MNKQINEVVNRENRTTSQSVFNSFDQLGQVTHKQKRSVQVTPIYSEYQNFLYKRARFGLSIYNNEEVKAMHWQKRNRIKKVQKKAYNELNTLKQNKVIEISNKILALFHHSSLAEELIDVYSDPDPAYNCELSFKELNIKKEVIIDRLCSVGVLPRNFNTLTQEAQS